MKKTILHTDMIQRFKKYLEEEERSNATILKYIRDIQCFYEYLGEDKTLKKEDLVKFKHDLSERYKITTVNSMLVALNGFFRYLGLQEFRLKLFKIQKNIFYKENKELTKEEYKRLLITAKKQKNERLYMVIQTICATGIRVSELRYITMQTVKEGKAVIHNKGKVRVIFISKELKKVLYFYGKKHQITQGSLFVSKYGNPLDRSNIWSEMKKLCEDAHVEKEKVFPHNLRHLFALTYYRMQKDIVRLADILGHSSIETTRVYTKIDGQECQKVLSKLHLVQLC